MDSLFNSVQFQFNSESFYDQSTEIDLWGNGAQENQSLPIMEQGNGDLTQTTVMQHNVNTV